MAGVYAPARLLVSPEVGGRMLVVWVVAMLVTVGFLRLHFGLAMVISILAAGAVEFARETREMNEQIERSERSARFRERLEARKRESEDASRE